MQCSIMSKILQILQTFSIILSSNAWPGLSLELDDSIVENQGWYNWIALLFLKVTILDVYICPYQSDNSNTTTVVVYENEQPIFHFFVN